MSSSFGLVSTLELSLSLVLLARGIYHYLYDVDWWLYTPMYLLATFVGLYMVIVNSTRSSKSKSTVSDSLLWRSATSLLIVVGGLYVAFSVWSLRQVASGHVSVDLHEAREIVYMGAAVLMASGGRLVNNGGKYNLLSIIRLIMVAAIAVGVCVPAIAFSMCFYEDRLPFCKLIHI